MFAWKVLPFVPAFYKRTWLFSSGNTDYTAQKPFSYGRALWFPGGVFLAKLFLFLHRFCFVR